MDRTFGYEPNDVGSIPAGPAICDVFNLMP